jgi:hypothetical protein
MIGRTTGPSSQKLSKLSVEERDRLRAEVIGQAPPSYSPAFHLLFPSLVGFSLIAVAVWLIHDLHAWQLAAIPVAFLVLNAGEWRVHRDLLHRRTPPLAFLYDRHTPEHHMIFITEDMSIRSSREFRLVLIPAWGIVVAFVSALPIPVVLALLGQLNLGMLFIITTLLYVLSYEWLHLSYHLPPDSFIGRRKLIGFLRRHHATHHDPVLMQKWNFNVSIPLWDLVRGTVFTPAREQARKAAAAARPTT